MTQRAETMLELVLDIKNNRRTKGSTPASALDSLLGQGSLRWLRESHVVDVQLRAVSWQKLLQPDKKVRFLLFLSLATSSHPSLSLH